MLANWEEAVVSEEEDEPEGEPAGEIVPQVEHKPLKTLTDKERLLLEQFVAALEANQERDPKYPLW